MKPPVTMPSGPANASFSSSFFFHLFPFSIPLFIFLILPFLFCLFLHPHLPPPPLLSLPPPSSLFIPPYYPPSYCYSISSLHLSSLLLSLHPNPPCKTLLSQPFQSFLHNISFGVCASRFPSRRLHRADYSAEGGRSASGPDGLFG